MSRAGYTQIAPGDAIFLSFLLGGPISAYDIKKLMAISVSHFWSAAHSQVYQQAARLTRDGFVKERDAGGARRKKLLSLTPKGRRAVAEWLRSPAAPPELSDESLAKLFFAAHGDRSRTIEMLEEQRTQHEATLKEYEEIYAFLSTRTDDESLFQLDTLKLGIRVTRAYLEWIEDTVARIGGGAPR